MAEKKEDRRVRKTKRQLRQALTELLKEKPIQEIKVREIADLIDINRGTFYQHYRDICEMLLQIEDELFSQFNQILAVSVDGAA
ncbi:MAG: TetR/AcrR family transcriptional regulator, partial [Eubacterium sp.]